MGKPVGYLSLHNNSFHQENSLNTMEVVQQYSNLLAALSSVFLTCLSLVQVQLHKIIIIISKLKITKNVAHMIMLIGRCYLLCDCSTHTNAQEKLTSAWAYPGQGWWPNTKGYTCFRSTYHNKAAGVSHRGKN